MPFPFSSILPHLQQIVLQKLTFSDYSRFSQCSQNSKLISNCLNRKLPFIQNDITAKNGDLYFMCFRTFQPIHLIPILKNFHVRIASANLSLNEVSFEMCEKMIKLLESRLISTKSITVDRIGDIDAELFNDLLKVALVEKLENFGDLSFEHLRQPEVLQIPSISIFHNRLIPFFNLFEKPIPGDILLSLKAEGLHLHPANFNAKDLNSFFKQWYQGARDVVFLRFGYEADTTGIEELKRDDEIFQGIPHEFLWSPDLHPNSVFAKIDKGNFQYDFEDLKGLRCFSIKRENTSGEYLFVRVYQSKLLVNLVDDVKEAFVEMFID